MLDRLRQRTGALFQADGAADATMARRRGVFTARLLGTLLAVVLLGVCCWVAVIDLNGVNWWWLLLGIVIVVIEGRHPGVDALPGLGWHDFFRVTGVQGRVLGRGRGVRL